MHMTAIPPTEPIRVAEQLEEERLEIRSAPDQRRSAAVIKGHCISIGEMIENAGDDALFANAEVQFPRDEPISPEFGCRFLEGPHPRHLEVEVFERCAAPTHHQIV